MNVVCTNVRKVHSHFSLGEYETSPAHYSPVNSESVLPTEALIAESHGEEFQVHSKSRHHFSKTASSCPGQSCPHKVYSGKPFRIFDQNKERHDGIKLQKTH